jgi:hypothetical protein
METCKHRFKLNEGGNFVFCSKCGKRWGDKKPTLLSPIVPRTAPVAGPENVPGQFTAASGGDTES